MRRSGFSVVSIVLFVFAGLFALYTVWAAIYAINYISEMVAADQLVIKGSEFEVANFLMSNSAQYAFFAIVLFALGRIIQVVSSNVENVEDIEDVEAEEDEELPLEEISDQQAGESSSEDLEHNKDE